MKKLFKYSILSIFPIFLLAQSAEVVEPIDDRALMEKAIEIEASSSNKATERQDYIDNIDTQIITLTGDIQFLSQQLDLTNIYNRQLQELIDSQNAEIISINEQMVELDKTNRGILPKLEEMVTTLASIVENDVPFLLEERQTRINELKVLHCI
jgi:flagellar motility protein MotE (MotC chaperone)